VDLIKQQSLHWIEEHDSRENPITYKEYSSVEFTTWKKKLKKGRYQETKSAALLPRNASKSSLA